MKKNLKKVISAVIALALSISSFASLSFAATEYTDVPSTASYAEGANVLSALGIVEGKGEGKFDPEGLVKRSEAAKMVTGMVNAMAAAEKKAGRTSFTDVAANHWASGYIQHGVDEGWIKGKAAGRFDPDGNVKVAELIKMIVVNLGWTEQYMDLIGVYPTVYTKTAEDYFVDPGEYDYSAAATRAECVEIIYNAMKAPIARESSDSTWSDKLGTFITKPVAQDPEVTDGVKYYRSLLSEKFNTYVVEGTAAKNANVDEVVITIDYKKTETYKQDALDKDSKKTITVKVGDTKAADYIAVPATALVKIEEDEDPTLITFAPSTKNTIYTLDASLFDDMVDKDDKTTTTFAKDVELLYLASADSTKADKYEVNKDTALYVNGVSVTADAANIAKYLTGNGAGKVELVDTYGSTDDTIDTIFVEYYATAMVRGVTGEKISLATGKTDSTLASTIDLDADLVEDGELVYNIYVDGVKGSISDIKKDDVLSIAWDLTTTSKFYNIYVSRETVEGKVTSLRESKTKAVVGGETYKGVVNKTVSDLTLNKEYKFYLDTFGRIFKAETTKSNAQFAIISSAYLQYETDPIVRLILADGTTVTYNFSTDAEFYADAKTADDKETPVKGSKIVDEIKKIVTGTVSANIANRVVKYEMKKGEVSSMTVVGASKTAKGAEYNDRTDAIGAVILDDAAIVFDATRAIKKDKIAEMKLAAADYFKEDVEYSVLGYIDPEEATTECAFVIVTAGEGGYNAETAFAVVAEEIATTTNDEGIKGYEVTLAENGETKTLFTENNISALNIGDVIVYTLDAAGEIDEYVVIYAAQADDTAKAFFTALDKTYGKYVTIPAAQKWTTAWDPSSADEISVIFAPIMEVDDKTMTLAQIKDNKSDLSTMVEEGDIVDDPKTTDKDEGVNNNGGYLVVGINDDTRVNVYDYSEAKEANRVIAGSAADIYASDVLPTEANKFIYDWSDANNKAADKTYALAKVVNGVATDVYLVIVK